MPHIFRVLVTEELDALGFIRFGGEHKEDGGKNSQNHPRQGQGFEKDTPRQQE